MSQGKNSVADLFSQRVLGTHADREVVPRDPDHCVRWHQHDYPCPTARWNYHPEFEIHLIRKGRGTFIVGDHIGTFEAGQVCLVGSGIPHDWVSDRASGEVIENRDAVIQFHPAWFRQCAELIPELTEMNHLLHETAKGVEFTGATAERAASHIEAVGGSDRLERLHHLVSLFTVLARSPDSERRRLADGWVRPDLDDETTAVAEIALGYLFERHSGAVKLSDAADLVGMTEPTFSKHFKRATGQTFSDILRKLRIAHARQLLEGKDLRVSDICYEAGYANLSNFNRQFLREVGQTPREYRRRAHSLRQAR